MFSFGREAAGGTCVQLSGRAMTFLVPGADLVRGVRSLDIPCSFVVTLLK